MKSRPHIMINMAMSIDGKASSIAREPTTFTSREDKHLLQKIRSRCDAIVVAAGTATIDRATLSVLDPELQKERVRRGQAIQPIRIIVSGHLNLSPSLPVFKKSFPPLWVVCCETAPRARRERFARICRLVVCGRREVNVRQLVSKLVKEYEIRVLLCEGGPTFNDAFFRANLVDELYVTLCPRIVGGKTAPTLVEGVGFSRLKDARHGRLISCRKGETEWFLHYRFH